MNERLKNLKPQILELREQGLSYNKICVKLGCSKSVISYHLDPKASDKQKSQRSKRVVSVGVIKKLNKLKSKVDRYRRDKNDNYVEHITGQEALDKIGENPICYLTGEPIRLLDTRVYTFHHHIPPSRGGKHDIENLRICKVEACNAKRDMLLDEFLEFCEKVLIHNGYSVKKKK